MRLESTRSADHVAADAAKGTVDLGLMPDNFRFFDAETSLAKPTWGDLVGMT